MDEPEAYQVHTGVQGVECGAPASACSDLSQKEAGIIFLVRSGIYDMAKKRDLIER